MGRHPVHRTKMSVVTQGKPAITHYQPIKRFRVHTHVRIQLETGRTHQIRVHLAEAGAAILSDPIYGRSTTAQLPRLGLHAEILGFKHPTSGELLEFRTDWPQDLKPWIVKLGLIDE